VSDERAAEVSRLASDRSRLLAELVEAEQRERARLAESLHDGPIQRLIALRQDAAEQQGSPWDAFAGHLDQTISDTRAIMSAFHPEMGDLVLEVNDDGVGIDSSDAGRAVQAGHLGLAMVRRRVEDAGGILDIETRPDGGTRSRVTLPIEPPCISAEWPRGLNLRGHPLDACSITSWTHPAYLASRQGSNTPKAVAAAIGGEGGIMGWRM
jgi:signal transduction histidine kinase